MSLGELENAIMVMKWIAPVLSGGFLMIIGLLVYIWKTNTNRTDNLLEKIERTLEELVIANSRFDERIKALENK